MFSHTRIDFFRSLNLKFGWGTVKHDGIIFTSLMTRASHFEVVHSLNTTSCLYAINTFLNKYVFPTQVIYSDNETNFYASQNEMSKMFEQIY